MFENQESEWISKQLCINYTVRDLVQTFAPFAREAPFWNLLVLYGLCPNSFRPPSVKQANVGKKSAQTILASPPLCFRIGGAEDNFIFYIEYCFFFVPVKKLRWEYNTLKQFESISCLMFNYGHIFPRKLWFGEKSAFLSRKKLIPRYSKTFQLPKQLDKQKMIKI